MDTYLDYVDVAQHKSVQRTAASKTSRQYHFMQAKQILFIDGLGGVQ